MGIQGRKKQKPKPIKSHKMKHTTETKNIYEPMNGLKIEIESNGQVWMYHQGELCEIRDFKFDNHEDILILSGIADAIKFHCNKIIQQTLTPPTNEQ